MITPDEIEKLAEWSAPKEVNTKRGPRLLRKAKPTHALYEAAKDIKADLYRAGVSIGYDKYARDEMATWWLPLPEAVVEARAQAVVASRSASADIELPAPDGMQYRPFQRAGIAYALARRNTLIADDMGLGKTIQAIGFINASPEIDSALIVCPKSLKLNWYRELSAWLVRGLSYAVADGVWPIGADIVIVNYEGVKKYKAQIQAREWGVLVLDEAHYIKNGNTERSAFIKGRAASDKSGKAEIPAIRATRHLRLTGTPIQNRPIELHNIISDLDPMWANFFSYAKRYCDAKQIRAGRKMVWDFSGASNLDELQRKLRESIMVRRLKADVLTELPAKVRQVIELEAEDPQMRAAIAAERAAFSKLSAEAQAALENDYASAVRGLSPDDSLAFTEYSAARHESAVAKVPYVLDHLATFMDEDSSHKVIVGAHHHDVIAALADGCRARGWDTVTLTGENNETERDYARELFQNNAAVRVFIGSILAAGVGLTLTASSHVVFAELDWVPGNVSQFEDRAHRMGQRDSVLVQHLLMAGSLDVNQAHKIVDKQAVIGAALDAETRPVPAYVAPEARQPRIERQAAPVAATTTPEATRQMDAPAIPAEVIQAAQAALRIVAGMDTDRAAELNGIGFSKVDGSFGHSLAAAQRWSAKQAAAGVKLARKYRRQIPADLAAVLAGKE